MQRLLGVLVCLPFALAVLPAVASDVDGKTVEVATLERPSDSIGGLDFAELRAEIAFGAISVGEPALRTTKSRCTPEHGDDEPRDAAERPTHYYEVPFRAGSGVLVVRDGAGRPVYTESLDAIDSDERFGFNRCAYVMPGPLEDDFRAGRGRFEMKLEKRVRESFVIRAKRAIDRALFFETIDERSARTSRYRGRIPVLVRRSTALAALRLEHDARVSRAIFDDVDAVRADRDEALASGRVNPFERQVGHTAARGFYLFLMPYAQRFEDFPDEVTGLTQLNRLRVPGHGFDALPDSIGRLDALEVLNLSGNALTALPESIGDLRSLRRLDLGGNNLRTLPDSIGRLKRLESLTLEGNPLAAGELERLERLLPGCKIKG